MYTTYSAVGTEQLQGWLTVDFELASFFFGSLTNDSGTSDMNDSIT